MCHTHSTVSGFTYCKVTKKKSNITLSNSKKINCLVLMKTSRQEDKKTRR